MTLEELQKDRDEWKAAAELWREDYLEAIDLKREANSKLVRLVHAFKQKNANYCNGCYGIHRLHAVDCPLRELEL